MSFIKQFKTKVARSLVRTEFQGFYDRLFHLALTGMGYGNASSVEIGMGERHLLTFIKQKQRTSKPVVLFDVGANIGKYSQLLLDTFGDAAQIYAFEPSSDAMEKLLARFHLRENVHLFKIALGKDAATGRLVGSSSTSVRNFVVSQSESSILFEDPNAKFSEEIQIARLDDVVGDEQIEYINRLKVDIEGGELAFFKGAQETILTRKAEVIQFEFGDKNMDFHIIFKDLYDLLVPHYQVFRMLSNGFYPITPLEVSMSLYKSTNFVALKM